MKKIAIIGSGLTGLSCARILKRNGFDVSIYESGLQPGGQLRSLEFEGYNLNRGSDPLLLPQKLFSKWPELKRIEVKKSFKRFKFYIPALQNPLTYHFQPGLFERLLYLVQGSDHGEDRKKMREFNRRCASQAALDPFAIKLLQYLREDFQFSEDWIHYFFSPLEKLLFGKGDLQTPAPIFLYFYASILNGDLVHIEGGNQKISAPFAEPFLKEKKLHLNCPVVRISERQITTAAQTVHTFDHIVAATEAWNVRHLVPTWTLNPLNLGGSVATYVSKSCPWPIDTLHLFKDSTLIDSVSVQASPNNTFVWHVQSPIFKDETLERKLTMDLVSKVGVEPGFFRLLKLFRLPHFQYQHYLFGEAPKEAHPLWLTVAGSYLEIPGIEGALRAGERAATEIIQRFYTQKNK